MITMRSFQGHGIQSNVVRPWWMMHDKQCLSGLAPGHSSMDTLCHYGRMGILIWSDHTGQTGSMWRTTSRSVHYSGDCFIGEWKGEDSLENQVQFILSLMSYWDISKTSSQLVGNHLHWGDALGWVVSSHTTQVYLEPINMIWFVNTVLKDVIKYRWGLTGLGWS